MSSPEPETPSSSSSSSSSRRWVRVVLARGVAVLAVIVAIVGMVIVGNSAGTDRSGLVPLILGVIVFVAALPFCGLNSPQPPVAPRRAVGSARVSRGGGQ